ncbi:MAG: peptidyl-prolyl cis-trans isomerase [Flavobacteriales bacterium]|nr:peptidyl-prolyl cis-trans isomerase [Flavobacteriales bacterium]
MKILKNSVLLFFITIGFNALAQKGGPPVFAVDQDTIWGAEFERVFSKNRTPSETKPSIDELQDYMDRYINFKLQIKEAYALGMDTNADYIKELAGYRKQLAQPYLTDKSVTERLISEGYERMQYEVEASNMMIAFKGDPTPKDTLEAYNRIMNWYNLIKAGKLTFEEVNRDSSNDPHCREQGGKLGYFSAFNMVYPFETAAYSTAVGDISKPFRTQFGYHIVKVTDKRKARGDLKVAHILIAVNNDTEYDKNKPRIDAIYERLKKGDKFEVLAKEFSEDYQTRDKGGELNVVKSIGRGIPDEFREVAYSLKDGQFSEPVKTDLGWHIIKRIEQKPLPEFKDVKETIKYRISRDSRSELNKEAVLNRIKRENHYELNKVNWDKYVAMLKDGDMMHNWEPTDAQKSEDVLFSIAERNYTFHDFTDYVMHNMPHTSNQDVVSFAKQRLGQYVDNQNLQYEESILETKFDDFKYLMQEYREGILIFELKNEKIWTRASEDTVGLKNYFDNHRDKYVWKDRVVTKQYDCMNKKIAKQVSRMRDQDSTDASILAAINKKDALALNIIYKTYEKGQNEKIDQLDWHTPQHKLKDKETKHITFVEIDSIMPSRPKELKETLGPVTSEYQEVLEQAWVNELKAKYAVHVFDGALEKLFSNLKN